MNPRAEAANNFNRGIKGKDITGFNKVQTPNDRDKKAWRYGVAWFSVCVAFSGYLAFMTDATNVFKNQQMELGFV